MQGDIETYFENGPAIEQSSSSSDHPSCRDALPERVFAEGAWDQPHHALFF
ncbi:hypothetical protein [Amycolatopsis regifaucium]|uniref:hypothetical protein n=1 Tax=Amycolatopsis regifaucium TaxID=546365 RepID=UPI0008F64379|nr:hypothetical protein [Amycolatopsis regifaucium]SFJ17336.1 hypothetical protein SAMN04489731_116110 [Amycolatopsis regifaucium]